MKVCLLNTNGIYSHAIVYNGINEAFHQLKNEDNDFDFIEHNINHQDDGTIEKYEPDYIFVSAPLAAGFRIWQAHRNIKCLIYDTEGLYEPALMRDSMSYATFAATVDKRGCEYFNDFAEKKNVNCKVYHMPLGFSPDIYRFQDVPDDYKSDIVLAGAIFNLRRKVIDDLSPISDKIKFRVIAPSDWVGRIIRQDAIQFLHRDIVSVSELGKYYAGSKIILCVNRDYDPSNDTGLESTTPGRVFQETACRRMVMIDSTRNEIFDYFEDGKEIVSFENSNDLREKVLYYLDHEEEREAIAHNGYIRTMNENTWFHRIKGFLNFVKENE